MGRRARAAEYVIEENRDSFLSGDPIPILEASVIGLDFTESRDAALVRTTIRALMLGTSAPSAWTFGNRWVRRNNNWYIEVGDPRAAMELMGNAEGLDAASRKKNIDANLSVAAVFDAGTLRKGQVHVLKVPVEYTGELPLTVESEPRTFIYTAGEPLNQGAFRMFVDPDGPQGEVTLPLKLRFSNGDAVVERSLTVKANFFYPVSFRQEPDRPVKTGEVVTLFIRNNTDRNVGINVINMEHRGETLERPDVLRAGQETKLVYRPLAASESERVEIHLDAPLSEIITFHYTIPRTP